MKKIKALLTTLSFAGAAMAQTTWSIDKEHSHIGFAVYHFTVSQTTGYFRDFDAKVLSNTDDFNGAKVTFTARTATVFTGNEQRDRHLQSASFLDAKKYPEMKFAGTIIKDGNKYLLNGDLSIRDVTRPVSFPVTFTGHITDSTFHADKVGLKVTGNINRLDYGLKWDETFQGGAPIVGHEVELNVIVELNKEE
jgi:polyisoprenoid-binding protein YceI